jgi:hypothetical protein
VSDADPTLTPCTVVCRTAGCPLEGKARTVGCSPNTEPPIYRAWCAQCEEIADVTPQA